MWGSWRLGHKLREADSGGFMCGGKSVTRPAVASYSSPCFGSVRVVILAAYASTLLKLPSKTA